MNRSIAALVLVVAPLLACGAPVASSPSLETTAEPLLSTSPVSAPTHVLVLVQGTCLFMTDCSDESDADLVDELNAFFTRLASTLPSSARIGVISFGSPAPRLLRPLGPPASLRGRVFDSEADYKGFTSALEAGLAQAHRRLSGLPGRRVIVMIGDGATLDEGFGRDGILEAVAPFRAAGIELHAFGVLPKPGADDLRYRLHNIADPDRYLAFDTIGDGVAMASALASIVGGAEM